jgi:DNA-binding YbaB/EbfC family protein
MGSGFSKMKKQAKMLQQQFSQMQEEMKSLVVTGSAGNGLVQIEMNGDKEVLRVNIKPDCIDKNDIEGLQDLIIAAFKDAETQVKQQTSDASTGNLPFGF